MFCCSGDILKPRKNMRKVRKGLYIGNLADMYKVLRNVRDPSSNISHVVSLVSTNLADPFYYHDDFKKASPCSSHLRKSNSEGDLPRHAQNAEACVSDSIDKRFALEIVGGITRLKAPLIDSPTENLLDSLETLIEFIDKSRKGGGSVLVHCMAGVSRSASVIIAYLMKTENLSLQEALTSLRKVSPTACPNEGFIVQLKVFEQMGCKVDLSHPVYINFNLSKGV